MRINCQYSRSAAKSHRLPYFSLATLWNFISVLVPHWPQRTLDGASMKKKKRRKRKTCVAFCSTRLPGRVIGANGAAVTGRELGGVKWGGGWSHWFLVTHQERGYFRERRTARLCLKTLFLCAGDIPNPGIPRRRLIEEVHTQSDAEAAW